MIKSCNDRVGNYTCTENLSRFLPLTTLPSPIIFFSSLTTLAGLISRIQSCVFILQYSFLHPIHGRLSILKTLCALPIGIHRNFSVGPMKDMVLIFCATARCKMQGT